MRGLAGTNGSGDKSMPRGHTNNSKINRILNYKKTKYSNTQMVVETIQYTKLMIENIFWFHMIIYKYMLILLIQV